MSNEYEGTQVLERLSEVGALDAFMEAVDADDLHRARSLMRQAGMDSETIRITLEKIQSGET